MKRSELYDRIWSTPATKIAEELGISGSRVAAICKRHNIPTPPRGYWAKLGVGKHAPQPPLPQPEADYEMKIQTPDRQPKSSAWVAPGVLLRPETIEEPPAPAPTVRPKPQPAAAWPFRPPVEDEPPPARSVAWSGHVDVDLELVRAASAELEGIQAINKLLEAVAARAVHAGPEEARRILTWAAAVRGQLDLRDPVAALLRINLSVSDNCHSNCCTDSQRISPTPLSE